MCEYVGGSILGSVHRDDPAGHRLIGRLEDRFEVTRLASILERADGQQGLSYLGHLSHQVFQVTVPDGSERAIAADMLRQHLSDVLDNHGVLAYEFVLDPDKVPLLEPEAIPQTSQLATPAGHPSVFSFTPEHAANLALLGPRPSSSATPSIIDVGVIDSGYADTHQGLTIASELDLSGGTFQHTAPDSYGHGSVVASIVHDVAPHTRFRIYKICDGPQDARELGFLAALLQAAAECRVVNASVGFGLHDRSCASCGRDYHSSRSLVFQRTLENLLTMDGRFLFVSAAGNAGRDRPTYPARYQAAISVGSTDALGVRSTFSNYGALDPEDQPHPSTFFAPGGDRWESGAGSDEYVASFLGHDWRGTSFATAYVTGLVADHLSTNPGANRMSVLADMTAMANPALVQGYTAVDYGQGMVQRF